MNTERINIKRQSNGIAGSILYTMEHYNDCRIYVSPVYHLTVLYFVILGVRPLLFGRNQRQNRHSACFSSELLVDLLSARHAACEIVLFLW